MTRSLVKINIPNGVLSSLDIKTIILRRGDSVSKLAREWGVAPDVLSRVIHRRGYSVYPEIRQKLADYLGVDVSKVGREPSDNPKSPYAPREGEPIRATA